MYLLFGSGAHGLVEIMARWRLEYVDHSDLVAIWDLVAIRIWWPWDLVTMGIWYHWDLVETGI